MRQTLGAPLQPPQKPQMRCAVAQEDITTTTRRALGACSPRPPKPGCLTRAVSSYDFHNGGAVKDYHPAAKAGKSGRQRTASLDRGDAILAFKTFGCTPTDELCIRRGAGFFSPSRSLPTSQLTSPGGSERVSRVGLGACSPQRGHELSRLAEVGEKRSFAGRKTAAGGGLAGLHKVPSPLISPEEEEEELGKLHVEFRRYNAASSSHSKAAVLRGYRGLVRPGRRLSPCLKFRKGPQRNYSMSCSTTATTRSQIDSDVLAMSDCDAFSEWGSPVASPLASAGASPMGTTRRLCFIKDGRDCDGALMAPRGTASTSTEVLCELPEAALCCLARHVTQALADASFPSTWTTLGG